MGLDFALLLLALSVCSSLAAPDPSTLIARDIGSPAVPGASVASDGILRLTAGGKGIGLQSDEFHFFSTERTGDFDLRVRVSRLDNTHLWAKAGLMVRASTASDSAFIGVFSTPSGAGSHFQSRATSGGGAVQQGFFPANLPLGWLRLRAVGHEYTGYASYDGRRWTRLGSSTLDLGLTPLVGVAATAHSGTQATRADFSDFSDFSDVTGPSTDPVSVDSEPLGPSSRRTALVISEIMYHPVKRADGKDLEFVEIYNSQPYFEDISGWRIEGEIEYTFPAGTLIPGGGFRVVAAVPKDITDVYGLDPVLGPYAGKLSNGGGKLRLVGDHDAVFLQADYGTDGAWPKSTDGAGHSLVLARPSFGEGNPKAWSASRTKGGSPGSVDAVELNAVSAVRINEWLLPSDDGSGGFVELFNAGGLDADLSGLRLGTSPTSLPFVVATGTRLAPGAFLQWSWKQLGFTLSAEGGELILESADASRILDALTVTPQAEGRSAGRWPNGNTHVTSLSSPTPGASNSRPNSDLVINEINYHPINSDTNHTFVELHNAGATAIDLSGWRFTDGITFAFPTGSRIAAGGYLVIAKNAERLQQQYAQLDSATLIGNFSGTLSLGGERLELSRPVLVKDAQTGATQTVFAPMAEATFTDQNRWTQWSDGGGSTLERISPLSDSSAPASWADSDESGRGEWTTVEVTGTLDNTPASGGFGGGPPTSTDGLHILLMGEGECLVDNVQVLGPGGESLVENGTFETDTAGWTFSGNHIRTTWESADGDQSSHSLHLRASGNGDAGANKVFVKLSQTLRQNETATLRARVKWLRGWPEVLVRLRGNFLEAYGRLPFPVNPGTPGRANSKSIANPPPVIDAVAHFPVVPDADQSVVVSARVNDADGLDSVTLQYRVDPAPTLATVDMHDDGTSGDLVPGDGVYSGVIPAPGASGVVAFVVEAKDRDATSGTSHFPPGAAGRECLIRFGEGVQSGAFGTYRLWLTEANASAWQNRPNLSNEPIDSTFVYGNWRAVYNAGGRFAGSPYHQRFRDLSSDAHYVIAFPKDDSVLGASSFNKIHAPGNGPFDDNTLQREQTVYWMARSLGMPWLYRRFVHVYVNGSKRRTLMEDTQVGSDDFVQQFWPDDTEGSLFKMQPWFEFSDTTSQSLNFSQNSWCYVQKYLDADSQHKTRRYRWNWLVRGAEGTANDFSPVLQLVSTASDVSNADYVSNVERLVDVDEWMRFFAINHAAGNWDSVGYRNCQNTYSYKPKNGRWELIIWDANIVYGNSGSDRPTSLPLFTTSDPTLAQWFASGSPFRRRLLTAYYDLVNGPMRLDAIAPMMNAKYAEFQEHGVAAQSPEAVQTWITSARDYILSQISGDSAPFAVTTVDTSTPIQLKGAGPLNMAALWVNGTRVAVAWTTHQTWEAQYSNLAATNRLFVAALNTDGKEIPGTRAEFALAVGSRVRLRREAGEIVVEYEAARPGRHQLQAVSSLLSLDWQTEAEAEAVPGLLRFRLPAPQTSQKFYRILEP